MKKIILILFFSISLIPHYRQGKIIISTTQLYAQVIDCPPSPTGEEVSLWSWLADLLRSIGNFISDLFSAIANFFGASGGGGGEGYSSAPNQAFLWELLNTTSAYYGTTGAINYGAGTILSQLDSGWKIQVSTLIYSPDVQDCAGVYGGSAFLDKCNTCVGGTTGVYPCYVELDCAGVPNGTAYIDSCKVCVGGTTGLLPCVQDCAGIWGGKSYLDNNNECIDTTRKPPCDSTYIKMGDSLYAFLYKPEFADSLNKFKQGLGTDTLEKVISFGQNLRWRTFKATEIRISQNQYSVPPIYSYPGMLIYKMMHAHTFNSYNCFSAGDFYVLGSLFNNPSYQRITSQYVIACDSSVFAMEIEDSTMYSKFFHPMG